MSSFSSGLGLINFQGLVSGLNTSSIIQELVSLTTAQEVPFQAQIATLKNQNGLLNTINKDLLGILSALSPLLNSNTYLAKSATSSNTGVLSATADTTAVQGSYTLNVTQLASATSVSSQGSISSGAQGIGTAVNNTTPQSVANVLGRFADPDIQLQYAGFATAPTSGSFTLSHNGSNAVISVNAATDSLNGIIGKINAAGIGVTASLSGDKLTLTASDANPIGIGSSSDTSNFLSAANLTTGVVNAGPPYSVTSSVHLGAIDPNAVLTQASTVLANPLAPTATATTGGTLNSADTYQVEVLAYNSNGYLTQASPATTVTGNTAINVSFGPVAGATGYLVYLKDNTAGESTYQAIDIGNTTSTTINNHTAGARVNPTFNETGASVANFYPGSTGLTVPTTGTFTINGVSFSVASTDTVGTLLNKINTSTAGVTAVFNSNQDTITLTSTSTGSTAISLSSGSSNFLSVADLLSASQTVGKQSAVSVNGGPSVYNNSNTVTNAVSNVTLNLAGTGTSTLTVANNSQPTTDAFNSLVTALNKFETEIYNDTKAPTFTTSKTTNTTTQTNPPGILFGQFLVTNAQQNVETSILNPLLSINGPYQSLEDLGISFTQTNGVANSFSLNTTTLQSAINSNPQAVSNLVTQLAHTVQTTLKGLTDTTAGIPGIVTSNNSQVDAINKQIKQIQDSADAQQQQLQQQFAAMESFLAQEQALESFLSSQLGLLNTLAANFSGSSSASSTTSLAKNAGVSSLLSGG